MVQLSQTVQPSSIRPILLLAETHVFEVWTSDVWQAFLQADEPLEREVLLLEPPVEFDLQPVQCPQLLKLLYGLCESGDMWHEKLDDHHRK